MVGAGDPASFGALLPLITDRYHELSRGASRCFEALFAPGAYCRRIAERLAPMQGTTDFSGPERLVSSPLRPQDGDSAAGMGGPSQQSPGSRIG